MITEKEYEQAKAELYKMYERKKELKKLILDYENANAIPEFKSVKEIIAFISGYEAQVGALFDYDGKRYKVHGDFEAMELEYGSESMSYIHEGDKTIEDLMGSWGLIELVK